MLWLNAAPELKLYFPDGLHQGVSIFGSADADADVVLQQRLVEVADQDTLVLQLLV